MKFQKILSLVGICWVSAQAYASVEIPMLTADKQQDIGTLHADDTIYGLLVTPKLHDLTPGTHGFHIHQMPACGDHAMAAGGHLDPGLTNQHKGPYEGGGHLGDMPVLIVNKDGTATLPVLAPRLKLADLKNHTVMIHEGSDNYSDIPEKLGGGGARVACGVVPEF
jgi:Cu-Zn family superoxide dismutase